MPTPNRTTTENGRQYMIALYKWRSGAALGACVVTLMCAAYGIVAGMILYTRWGVDPAALFRYFTIDSNILTALAAAFIVPYAVEGLRRKQFTYPKWLALFHFAGTICVTLTMVFSVLVMSWYDAEAAFGGYNFFLHILCPLLVLISFFLVESGNRFTIRESFFCAIPVLCYGAVYFIEVLLIGESRGGWPDLYQATTVAPWPVSILAILAMAAAITFLIRRMHNKLADLRKKQLMSHWREDISPVEVKIEVFGLGRYMGLHGVDQTAALPMVILDLLAERYSLTEEELARPFLRGMLDGRKEAGRN